MSSHDQRATLPSVEETPPQWISSDPEDKSEDQIKERMMRGERERGSERVSECEKMDKEKEETNLIRQRL